MNKRKLHVWVVHQEAPLCGVGAEGEHKILGVYGDEYTATEHKIGVLAQQLVSNKIQPLTLDEAKTWLRDHWYEGHPHIACTKHTVKGGWLAQVINVVLHNFKTGAK